MSSWTLARGATVRTGGVRFVVWAPNAKEARVRLVSGHRAGDHTMHPVTEERGAWAADVDGAAAGDDYQLVIVAADGEERVVPDPVSRWQPQGVHGPSRVVDPRAFEWRDSSWRGIAMRDLVLYELHVGTFTDAGTFDAIVGDLPRLRTLGVNAIEIMPVAQFPGARNWGYDGVGLYAVQDSYGGPDGLKRLVDAAHGAGIAVILDCVYNHLGPEGNYLDAFGPYFTDRYTTPWGRAVNYDGAGSDEVRRFVVDNAKHWICEYHIDGLRLDAVHGIYDFGARHLLAEMAAELHGMGRALERTVVVIGESDLNDPRLLWPEPAGHGLDGQWADDFHHAAHALVTGERAGYYADFGGLAPLAASLREPFVYAGTYSAHRDRRHGASSAGLPREHFVVCIQNHDQVGNRAAGERLAALVPPERQRLAASLLLLSPYVPLLFMGEEWGETNPFQYFISHGDPQLVEAVRTGRRREFEAFGWGDEVPDPQDEATFARSRPDRAKRAQPSHAALEQLYTDLLALRRDEPALRPDGADVEVTHDDGAHGHWLVLLRRARTAPTIVAPPDELLAVFNCGDAPASLAVPAGAWRLRFSSDSPAYGGEGRHPLEVTGDDAPRRLLPSDGAAGAAVILLPPWSAALYQRTHD